MAGESGRGMNKKKARQQKKMQGRRQARRAKMVSERHKAKRLLAHLARFPWHVEARDALARLEKKCFGAFKITVPSLTESPKQTRGKLGITLSQMQKSAELRAQVYG